MKNKDNDNNSKIKGNVSMSFREIAQKLNMGETTVQRIYRDAIKKIEKNERFKQMLKDYCEL